MPEKRDRIITMSDVNELFKNNVEVKNKPRGYNSFVASNNNHTYQIGTRFPRMIKKHHRNSGWFGCH